MCNLVFNSEYFDGKVQVPTSYSMIGDSDCYRNTISFRRDDVVATVGEREFSEWMIVCYMSPAPFNYDTDYSKAYYLSRADSISENAACSNDIFVYRHGESDFTGNLHYYLVNVFTKVKV